MFISSYQTIVILDYDNQDEDIAEPAESVTTTSSFISKRKERIKFTEDDNRIILNKFGMLITSWIRKSKRKLSKTLRKTMIALIN